MARSNLASARPALRQLHIWVSVFIAPSLIFFAVTGALQTFRIPDRPGAPALMVKLARVHKDDVFALKPQRPRPPPGRAEQPRPKPQPAAKTQTLKWFFTIVSVAIAATSAVGVWLALTYSRDKWVIWALFVAGALAPIAILAG